jgi:hypothetical protein
MAPLRLLVEVWAVSQMRVRLSQWLSTCEQHTCCVHSVLLWKQHKCLQAVYVLCAICTALEATYVLGALCTALEATYVLCAFCTALEASAGDHKMLWCCIKLIRRSTLSGWQGTMTECKDRLQRCHS